MTDTWPQHTVMVQDALVWCQQLATGHVLGPVITSPPDAAEVGQDITAWGEWFQLAVEAACLPCGNAYPAVFYVTDRRIDGRLESKADLVLASIPDGWRILWHKIALRRDPGKVDLYRPTYSHMIAVGPKGTTSGTATADVFPRGPVLYPNGMGINAAREAVRFVGRYIADDGVPILNPFCGRGTVLAAAAEAGFMRVGCDNDPEQVAYAERATLPD